jgi:outer membrane protein TolC
MSRDNTSAPVAAAIVAVCGLIASCASYGMPVQHLADADASIRSARDSYAIATPSAQLHLKLAEEAVARAKHLIDDGDYRRADFVLVRARSDAELAVGEEREAQAEADAQNARAALSAIQGQGPEPASVTRTTGATVPLVPSSIVPQTAPPSTENGGPR